MIKLTERINLEEAGALMQALDVMAQKTDNVRLLPFNSCAQYAVCNSTILFRYNSHFAKDDSPVDCTLIALNQQDYRGAKFLLQTLAPTKALLTEELHDW